MVKTVDLTQQHLDAINVGALPMTVRGIALVEGEQVLAVGGIYPEDGHWVLASRFSDDLYQQMKRGRCVKALLRAARQMLALTRARRMPVYAIADPEHAGSATLLQHLGFTHDRGDVWLISA